MYRYVVLSALILMQNSLDWFRLVWTGPKWILHVQKRGRLFKVEGDCCILMQNCLDWFRLVWTGSKWIGHVQSRGRLFKHQLASLQINMNIMSYHLIVHIFMVLYYLRICLKSEPKWYQPVQRGYNQSKVVEIGSNTK